MQAKSEVDVQLDPWRPCKDKEDDFFFISEDSEAGKNCMHGPGKLEWLVDLSALEKLYEPSSVVVAWVSSAAQEQHLEAGNGQYKTKCIFMTSAAHKGHDNMMHPNQWSQGRIITDLGH